MKMCQKYLLLLFFASTIVLAAKEPAPKPGRIEVNSVGMKMAYIPTGEFEMGSPPDEGRRQEDEFRHRVRISQPFRIAATEVTQAQWRAVMGSERGNFRGDDLPVEKVSWKDAETFCKKLSAKESALAGRPVVYRLPTEAEWEYACRAAAKGPFAGTGEIDEIGWHEGNSDAKTHPVAAKKPNARGLYDMHGNVSEWCLDYYEADYPDGPLTDPKGPEEGKYRVVRGGSWNYFARSARSAARGSAPAAYQMKHTGFRPVLELAAEAGESASSGNKALKNPFFAMDTGTKSAAYDTPEKQVQMLKELGYDGVDFTGVRGIPAMLEELDRNGMRLFAIYTGANLDAGKPTYDPGLKEALKQLKGRDTVVWVHLTSKEHKPSSTTGDERAVEILREIAGLARESGLRVAIYPHAKNYAERLGDALRLAEKADRPNLGVCFNLCHYLRVEKGTDLKAALKKALPRLFLVTVNGADADGTGWDRLIQPLDSGSFDTLELLRILKDLGYTGPIGLQGYGIKGDKRENLRRSMEAWRGLKEKISGD